MDKTIQDQEIVSAEKALLPNGCTFNDEARAIIRCWESKEITACPGSGKTTVLLAKLKVLANRMPFSDGSGICVLSHTNVAVNEIKSKMSDVADKLMGYPNYVGTIQSFVDKYIALPYLRTLTSVPIRPLEDRAYATLMMDLINNSKNYSWIKGLISRQFSQSGGQYSDEIDFLEGIHLEDDGLYPERGKKMAGRDKSSTKEYEKAVRYLLVQQGAIRFSDAYKYALEAIEKLDQSFLALFSKRFRYVFVDEYQDCDTNQREVIDKIFPATKCTIFKIGDADQSIFNGKDEVQLWVPDAGSLSLSYSNRYGQEIADVITHLRTSKEKITSSHEDKGFKPVLIVFDMNDPTRVIDCFINILGQKGITDPDGIYKVIGKRKNGSGLKIGDYWNSFSPDNIKSDNNYSAYIHNIQVALSNGKLYAAEVYTKKLLCIMLRFLKIKDIAGRYYTTTTINQFLCDTKSVEYGDTVFRLASLSDFNKSSIDKIVREFLENVIELRGSGSVLKVTVQPTQIHPPIHASPIP